MNRTLTALLISGSLAALPALAKQQTTKVRSNTNPAGSHTMVMTKSGAGPNRTMSKTMTNTEGNKVLTSSRTISHSKTKHVRKSNVQLAKLHKGHKQTRR